MQNQMNLQAAVRVSRTTRYRVTKRMFDLLFALFFLAMFSPLLIICAVLVRLSSPGPILFRQRRVGLSGREFIFLKFRSMYAGADHAPHREYVTAVIEGSATQHAAGRQPIYKLTGDSRVTPVGRWLRRLSLDELPQLWNVLVGDMSLVGPRPPIPYELDHYLPRHLQRLAAKPGITGLWQVSGRSGTTFEDMVRLDLQYIARASIWLDVVILFKTIPAVLACQAA